MKYILNILLVLLLSVLLVSCRGKQQGNVSSASTSTPMQTKNNNSVQNTPTETASLPAVSSSNGTIGSEISLVKKQYKTKYLLQNGIKINYQNDALKNTNTEIPFSIPQISGLVNKDLEKKINQSILADTEKEIKSYISKTNLNFQSHYLSCQVALNANNLLSIGIFLDDYPPLAGFLYRLTDGKRLFLKDIFTEGTDYVSLINEKMPEAILQGDKNQEENLMAPFSSVKPDQDFILSDSKLYMVFNEGEGGFVERAGVAIPLTKIDDYVDVTDRYSGTERKTQLNSNLIVRVNNVFNTDQGEVIKRDTYNILTHYPQISGLRDAAFENTINTTIKNSINEVLNYPNLDNMFKNKFPKGTSDLLAGLYVRFNHYGILCIQRNVNVPQLQGFEEFNKVYSFDLIKKKVIDSKDILKDYISKNKELESKLTSLIKQSMQYSNNPQINDFINKVNYSFIINNSDICFYKYPYTDTTIVFSFKPNTIKDVSNTTIYSIQLKDILKGAPEDFFGW